MCNAHWCAFGKWVCNAAEGVSSGASAPGLGLGAGMQSKGMQSGRTPRASRRLQAVGMHASQGEQRSRKLLRTETHTVMVL